MANSLVPCRSMDGKKTKTCMKANSKKKIKVRENGTFSEIVFMFINTTGD